MHLRRTLVLGLRSVSVLLLLGMGPVACQVVLGDFEIDDSGVVTGGLGTACAPNSFRCVGERLERCSDDRRRFDFHATCQSAGTCDATAGSCRACTPNEFSCSDGELRTCGADGAWTNPVSCGTAPLCLVATDRSAGSCDPPACEAGSFTCADGWLLVCAATRDRLDLVEYCGTDARCDAAAAAAAVMAGQRPHCATAACGEDCPRPVCTPGATRCSRDVPAVELCGTDGQWVIREACASRELCDGTSGRCLPPACNLGDTRCFGQTRQTCAEDLTSFRDLETCPDSGTCAPDGCEAQKCTDGTLRCNGVAHEICVAGEFVALNRCATRALCTPASGCETPICAPNVYDCSPDGRTLTTCLPGRVETRVTTCPVDTTCDERSGRCLSAAQMP